MVHFCHLDKAKYMHFNMPENTWQYHQTELPCMSYCFPCLRKIKLCLIYCINVENMYKKSNYFWLHKYGEYVLYCQNLIFTNIWLQDFLKFKPNIQQKLFFVSWGTSCQTFQMFQDWLPKIFQSCTLRTK